MASRTRRWFLHGSASAALALVAVAPLACKERDTAGQESRPLPTPEPPAAATAAAPRDSAVAPKKRVTDDDAASKTKPAGTAAAEKPGTVAAPASSADAAPSAAPAAALPVASAPVLAAPSAPCLAQCQGAMQGCLSAPVEGGVPGFGNLELCKKAFQACQSACAPK